MKNMMPGEIDKRSTKMIKVSKTKADGKYIYINIHGFSDDAEWDMIHKRVQDMIYDYEKNKTRKVRVF